MAIYEHYYEVLDVSAFFFLFAYCCIVWNFDESLLSPEFQFAFTHPHFFFFCLSTR